MAAEWKCPNCGGQNPAQRARCLGCNTPKPEPGSEAARGSVAASEWKCPRCGGTNPAGRLACMGCNTPRPSEANPPAAPTVFDPAAGWHCPNCGKDNPRGQSLCIGCKAPRPGSASDLKAPGVEWKCPSCGGMNPPGAAVCMGCHLPYNAYSPEMLQALKAMETVIVPEKINMILGKVYLEKDPDSFFDSPPLDIFLSLFPKEMLAATRAEADSVIKVKWFWTKFEKRKEEVMRTVITYGHTTGFRFYVADRRGKYELGKGDWTADLRSQKPQPGAWQIEEAKTILRNLARPVKPCPDCQNAAYLASPVCPACGHGFSESETIAAMDTTRERTARWVEQQKAEHERILEERRRAVKNAIGKVIPGMAEGWKCPACGGTNPAGRATCLGCNGSRPPAAA